MRKAVIFGLTCLLTAAVASAQMKVKPQSNPGATPLQVPGSSQASAQMFPRVSMADALKMYQQGTAVFIDVRSNEQFTLGHIKGAINIPGSQIVRRFAEIPRNKTIITYCACSAEQSSGRAAQQLIGHGVKNVFALKGGWGGWQASGHPVATGSK